MIRGEQHPVPCSQGLLEVLYSPELDIHNTMPALQRAVDTTGLSAARSDWHTAARTHTASRH